MCMCVCLPDCASLLYFQVRDGKCFSIKRRKFISTPMEVLKNKVLSPRCYKDYDSLRAPAPRHFVESLENSFSEDEMVKFVNQFYIGLMSNGQEFKVKKCCTVGERNSGKTTWGAIYKGIMPSNRVASVSREGTFAMSMLNEDTQICIMDEWSKEKLTADAVKNMLSGKHLSMLLCD